MMKPWRGELEWRYLLECHIHVADALTISLGRFNVVRYF